LLTVTQASEADVIAKSIKLEVVYRKKRYLKVIRWRYNTDYCNELVSGTA